MADLFPVTAADFQTGFVVVTVKQDGTSESNPINPDYCPTDDLGTRYFAFLQGLGFNNTTLTQDAPMGKFAPGGPDTQEDASGNPALVSYIDFVNQEGVLVYHENVGPDCEEAMRFGQDFFTRLVHQWYDVTLQ